MAPKRHFEINWPLRIWKLFLSSFHKHIAIQKLKVFILLNFLFEIINFYRSFLYHLPWELKMTMLIRLANLSLNGVLNLIQFILLKTKCQLWNQLKPFLLVSVTSIMEFEWSEMNWYFVEFYLQFHELTIFCCFEFGMIWYRPMKILKIKLKYTYFCYF